MSEIADMLQQKAGLSLDKAQEVKQLVVGCIMAKVPAEFQGILGSVLGTGQNTAAGQPAATESGGPSGLLGAATSLFGGNKG
jgi:hypothetical protein